MSRLIKAMRKKRQDTPNAPTISPKKREALKKRKKTDKPKTITDKQFASLLETFVSNKEAIKNIENTNTGYYSDLVEYTKAHGAEDAKGNRTVQVGKIVSLVMAIRPRQLNIDKVERFIQKLTKRSHLSKKEAKQIVYAEYTIKLSEDQYKRLEKHLEKEAVLADREVKVNEEALEMLIPKGVASIDEIAKCYDELPEKIQFRPTRVKE